MQSEKTSGRGVIIEESRWEEAAKSLKRGETKAAIFQFKRMVDEGSVCAMAELGNIYEAGGREIEPDFAEALKWYRSAANGGNVEAYVALGRMYYLGRGVTQDLKAAFHWYKALDGKGHPLASQALGTMYFWGNYPSRDLDMAEKLFLCAASKGYMPAMKYLAMIQIKRGKWLLGVYLHLRALAWGGICFCVIDMIGAWLFCNVAMPRAIGCCGVVRAS